MNKQASTNIFADPATLARMENRAALESAGFDLFPAAGWHPDTHVKDVQALFNIHADMEEVDRPSLRLAGRLVGRRKVGGIWFGDLWQEHERVQIRLRRDDHGAEAWFLVEHLDVGDFVGVEGRATNTSRGELTIDVTHIVPLCKALTAPNIGKMQDGNHYGAQADRGELLRARRHVELMTNAAVASNIRDYARMLRAFREQLHEEGYLELTTSIMGPFYGGAAATPFVTRSKATGQDYYLRVSPEPDLKRALVAGFDRVYEIGRNFRNEGIDATHQPSFTAIEVYMAWGDYEDMMELTERLVGNAVKAMAGNDRIRSGGRTLDFAAPWPRLRMVDLVARELGCSAAELDLARLEAAWDDRQPEGARPTSWGEFVVGIFEEYVEERLTGPCFVIDHPVEISPLTKRHRNDPRLVERFEAYVNGMELANAYSELNDPLEQRRRLEQQDNARDDPYGVDEYFLAAIDDGMPQAGGLGIGLDRLAMILSGADRISDVLPFPTA